MTVFLARDLRIVDIRLVNCVDEKSETRAFYAISSLLGRFST